MSTVIKPRRGSGSPAGSLAQNEIAMDVDARTLYVSSDGVDAVVLADNTEHFLANATSDITVNPKLILDDGSNIFESTATLTDAVLNIKLDESQYNKAQIMIEDSNAKVFSMVGQSSPGESRDKFIVTLDPDNLHSPTTTSNGPGDYGVYYVKEYNDIENPSMEMNVFGAKDGFKLRIYDDANSGSPAPGPLGYPGYGYKPMEVTAEKFQVNAKDSDTSSRQVFTVDDFQADFQVPIFANSGITASSDLSFEDSPLIVKANVNNLPGSQQNGAVSAFILKETTNNTRRNRMLLGTTDNTVPTYVAGIDSRFQNDEKKLRFTAPSDDDTGNSVNMFEMKSNLTAGTVQHNITGRIVQAGVDSTQQPQNFSMEADANGETYHEFLSSTLNTGADAIPNDLTSTYTFSAENDASGGPQYIGRFAAVYNSSEDQNEIVMSAVGHDGTTLSSLLLTQNTCEVSVPIRMASINLTTNAPAFADPGMMVYNTATDRPAFFNGSVWTDL